MYCQINHQVLPVSEASLSVKDLGLLRGYAAFDYFRFRERTPLFIDRHLDRLQEAADYLGITMPMSHDGVRQGIAALLEKNDLDEGAIRLLLTGGVSDTAYDPGDAQLVITIEHFKFPAAALYAQGIKVLLHDWVRPMPAIKSTFYPEGIRLLPKIRMEAAYDVLFCKDGLVSELSRSNFFLITKAGVLVTSDRDILEGVTRHHVLELARKRMPVEVRPLRREELTDAAEAFITGTTRRILSLVMVDDIIIGDGKPGPLSQQLMQDVLAFEEDWMQQHKTRWH